jgi:hypothetical protein
VFDDKRVGKYCLVLDETIQCWLKTETVDLNANLSSCCMLPVIRRGRKGFAVMRYLWCGCAVIFILTCGIAVLK